MEITKQQHFADGLSVVVSGRLDGYWADHLAKELAEVLREGIHQVRLDLGGVNYLSSAGIGTLVQFYKQFQAIQGSFTVVHASPQVRTLLNMTKLDALLVADAAAQAKETATAPTTRCLEHPSGNFEIFQLAAGETLTCEIIGDPSLLEGCRFKESDCRRLQFPASSFAVGLGAFGNDFTDCRGRFGEFLSVAGAAAYLPTDGTNVADYMVAAESFVPELQVLYCARARGRFSQLARFEAGKESGPVKLSEIVDAGFEIAEHDAIGIVMVAETDGLLGVSLRRSPSAENKNGDGSAAPFSFPAVRHWLSYSSEHTHGRSVALVAGIAVRDESGEASLKLSSIVRPLGSPAWPAGHFHAAAFPYRPLKRGALDLTTTVASLFEMGTVESVMHLINDSRRIGGAGESEFMRGACWVGPISRIVKDLA